MRVEESNETGFSLGLGIVGGISLDFGAAFGSELAGIRRGETSGSSGDADVCLLLGTGSLTNEDELPFFDASDAAAE